MKDVELERKDVSKSPRNDDDEDVIDVDGEKLTNTPPWYHNKYLYFTGLFFLFIIFFITGAAIAILFVTAPNLLKPCYLAEIIALAVLTGFILLWIIFFGIIFLIRAYIVPKFDKFQKKSDVTKCQKCCNCTWITFQVCFSIIALLAVLVVVSLSFGLSYFFISNNINLDGTVDILGNLTNPLLDKPAFIRRDAEGVVHIVAENVKDAYFAQGYATAQNRLWQLEYQRLLARGSLSETPVVGDRLKKVDIEFKTLRFFDLAKESISKLPKDVVEYIQSYVNGINAFIKESPNLSVEFATFLKGKPKPFSVEDVIAWGKCLSYSLSRNIKFEIERYKLMQMGIPLSRVEEIFPNYPDHLNPTILTADHLGLGAVTEAEKFALEAKFKNNTGAYVPKKVSFAYSYSEQYKKSMAKEYLKDKPSNNILISEEGFASNNWVLSGKKTQSGKPILGNDPHLVLSSPSTWILMDLTVAGKGALIGASFVGLPGIVIGRNDFVSWGITNTASDIQDVYVMSDTADGTGYYYNGTVENYKIYKYDLNIGGKFENITVKWSRYGPVINSIYNITEGPNLCLKWATLDNDDDMISSLVKLFDVTNFNQFRENFRTFSAPSMNLVYADQSGNIAYQMAGKVPIRKPGHSGQFPVPGDGSYDYLGWVPYDELPRVLNPAEGWISSANNRVAPRGYKYSIGLDVDPGYRASRLREILSNITDSTATIDTMKPVISDTESHLWMDSFKRVFQKISTTDDYENWRQKLLSWNGRIDLSSQEATVFEAWLNSMSDLLSKELNGLKPKLVSFFDQILENELFPRNVTTPPPVNGTAYLDELSFRRMLGYDDVEQNTPSKTDQSCKSQGDNNCLEFATRTFKNSIDLLKKQNAGTIPAWGKVHVSLLPHAALDSTPFACLASKEVNTAGGTSTLNPGNNYLVNGEFITKEGQSYMQIIDWSDLSKSLFMSTPGTSGNILSPHYDNLLDRWKNGQFIKMISTGYEIYHDLKLNPVNK